MSLSITYTFTLAAMDKPALRSATRAFAPISLVLLALLATAPAAIAQSAGDRQYADPLGGGDGSGQDAAPQPQGGDAPASSDDAPTAPPSGSGTSALPPGAEPAQTLPRTGGDAALLAAVGLALLAAGAALRRGPAAFPPS
jgi:LPXTG-motif cell wall-anchored protein